MLRAPCIFCGCTAALGLGVQLVDSLSSWVPASVPRPAAKVGVAVIGGTVLITLAQQVGAGLCVLAAFLSVWDVIRHGSAVLVCEVVRDADSRHRVMLCSTVHMYALEQDDESDRSVSSSWVCRCIRPGFCSL